MICKLCQQTVPKLVNSHIISEFMYQGMYDEKHRFFGLSMDPKVNDRLLQKGLRETLLCEHCDNVVLASYENYASRLLYAGVAHRSALDGNDLRLRDLDYAQIRLFFLSLLWRMSLSTHHFFDRVSLGPHEEIVRKMLLRAIPGEPDEYGFTCLAPVFKGQHLCDWIMPPDSVRFFNREIYRCSIGGLLYCYFVGRAALPRHITDRFVQKDGSWVIHREKIEKIKFLHDWCIQFGGAIEERRLQKGGEL